MTIRPDNLIGASAVPGNGTPFHGIAAAGGAALEPAFASADAAMLDRACELAEEAFDRCRDTDPETRAGFLEAIGRNILDLGDELVERCMAETGLPRGRVEGERGRTVAQLGLFARVVRDGHHLDLRIDPAQPGRTPLPRPDLRLRHVPVGPVAVFGAGNFPLAFSVAGGDTASALAAGCPVIVKAHPAHPGTSALVGGAVQRAVADCGLPEGVFSLLFDAGRTIGQGLVADPRVAAVGFTGSRSGGLALTAVAQARRIPIPVFAEMSSVNPVVLFPAALAARGPAIAKAFAASLTLGAGQFCTNPGLLLAVEGPALEAFLEAAGEALSAIPAATMLTRGILEAYGDGAERMARTPGVRTVAHGPDGPEGTARSVLLTADARTFLAEPALREEVFGAAALVVRCPDLAVLRKVLEALDGQLTAALHIDEPDHEAARDLLPLLERKAGRILVNGFGTGVEVAHAMVHGGPFPATSDGLSSSVGSLAIARFLRPVCYQDLPDTLLPAALKDANPLALPRRVDGGVPGTGGVGTLFSPSPSVGEGL